MTGKKWQTKNRFQRSVGTAGGRQKSWIKFLRGQRQSVSQCQPETNLVPVTGVPLPRLWKRRKKKNDWTFSETKELSDYRHYAACGGLSPRISAKAVTAKKIRAVNKRFGWWAAAADMEISAVGGEALLLLLESVSVFGEGGGIYRKSGCPQTERPDRFMLWRNVTAKAGRRSRKTSGRCGLPSIGDLARVLQQKRIVRKMQHDRKKKANRSICRG